jgi:hypothetical protein
VSALEWLGVAATAAFGLAGLVVVWLLTCAGLGDDE